jgi:hypothetical protein
MMSSSPWSDDMPLRFLLMFVVGLAAAPSCAAEHNPLLEGVVLQTVDLQIPDAGHQGVSAIIGMNMPLGSGGFIGEGSAGDVAAVAAALSKDDPAAMAKGPFPGAGLRVVVKLANGVLVVVLQPMRPRVSVGQPVRIEGSGRVARVVRGAAPAA